jgi:class I fructose-bisphosphate aldolase
MTPRVKDILSWYAGENPGTLTNLARILNHGALGGTGKLVVLPVDQGFEHGPVRSFAPNPDGYDPRYHFALAVEAGCNAHAAPLGAIEAAGYEFLGEIPLILKANNHDMLYPDDDPIPAVNATVRDAQRLGCAAIGFTIYPGSAYSKEMYEELRELADEARDAGLPVVVWSYPRGSGLSKEARTAVDVAAYAAHIAAQLGAHIIKVKVPSEHVESIDARKIYDRTRVPLATVADRVRHVVQSAFNGRRIVLFSGGPAKETEAVLAEVRGIHEGGGFGSIIGRNSFQRPKEEGLELLRQIIDIYKS